MRLLGKGGDIEKEKEVSPKKVTSHLLAQLTAAGVVVGAAAMWAGLAFS